MIYYITYSNDLYAKSRDFGAKMALKYGKVDRTIVYKPEDIDEIFREENRRILDCKAGNGYWLWKPYFLRKTLEIVDENDIVLYCDAASFMIRDCRNFLNTMDDDIWVSNIALIEKQFTKPELFETMDCCDERYYESNQIQANFIAVRKTERGVRFADEWLRICKTGDNILPVSRYDTNPPGHYVGHKSDQSVLSLLTKKWGVKPHLDPSQFGKLPEKYYRKNWIYKVPENNGEYKPSIILHRQKKPEVVYCLKMLVGIWLPTGMVRSFYKYSRMRRK